MKTSVCLFVFMVIVTVGFGMPDRIPEAPGDLNRLEETSTTLPPINCFQSPVRKCTISKSATTGTYFNQYVVTCTASAENCELAANMATVCLTTMQSGLNVVISIKPVGSLY